MAACAVHKAFLMSTIMIWMLVTMYVFRTGTGNAKTSDLTEQTRDSLKMMEELKNQNLQLKEIAENLRVMEMRKLDARLLESELKDKDKFLDSLNIKLGDCQIKNKELASRLLNLETENEKLVWAASNIGRGSSDSGMRSAYNHIVELWYFVNARLDEALKKGNLQANMLGEIDFIMEDVRARKSAALIELELARNCMQEAREEMKSLQELVQKRLHFLQNPKDCNRAKKLVCNLNKGCGFGCQLHHVVYCFMTAFGTERTLVLESDGWRYSEAGWESAFLPLSKTCITANEGNRVMWNGEQETKDDRIVILPIVDVLQRRPPYMPLSIPEDLAPTLKKLHGNPAVWWLGQLVSYLARPQPWLAESMVKFQKKIGFDHPIVGIHVRRTDKIGLEASFHGVGEYMVHAIDWYDKEDMKRQRLGQPKILIRKVYVASDDPSVLGQFRKLYPKYKILGDVDISKAAAVETRYTKSSLIGLLTDIFLLSQCDYLVGTFSSQVSRAAYELMQTRHADAASFAHSLDDVFYFGGQGAHSQQAKYDHVPRPGTDEIVVRAGDMLGIAGNHWDGYTKGVNRRTGEVGLYPSFKVVEAVTTVKYPTFPEAKYLMLNHTGYE